MGDILLRNLNIDGWNQGEEQQVIARRTEESQIESDRFRADATQQGMWLDQRRPRVGGPTPVPTELRDKGHGLGWGWPDPPHDSPM